MFRLAACGEGKTRPLAESTDLPPPDENGSPRRHALSSTFRVRQSPRNRARQRQRRLRPSGGASVTSTCKEVRPNCQSHLGTSRKPLKTLVVGLNNNHRTARPTPVVGAWKARICSRDGFYERRARNRAAQSPRLVDCACAGRFTFDTGCRATFLAHSRAGSTEQKGCI